MIRAVVFTACVVVASAASAEPLPQTEAVRACPHYGPGFYQVPGSATCTRISGRVATEFTTVRRRAARDDASGFSAEGRVSMDTRTETAYGPLRTFVRVKVRSGTGTDR